jgi:membrane fusion protein (multidrug efflux system)
VDGIVLKREFKEGVEVKTGQRLYQMDPAPCVPALNGATASVQRRKPRNSKVRVWRSPHSGLSTVGARAASRHSSTGARRATAHFDIHADVCSRFERNLKRAEVRSRRRN